jgi:FkbM family methyltransferase
MPHSMIGKMRKLLRRFPLFVILYQIFYLILGDKLNQGNRGRLLFNYFSWYLYHKPRNHTFQISLQNGMKAVVYPDSDSGVSNIFTKNVDYYEIEFVRNALDKGDFIIDAGCNVGNRTLVLADIIGGALLIDANDKCLDRLIENFKMNQINMKNYHVRAKAVGSEKKQVMFTDMGGTSCLNKIVDNDDQPDILKRYVEMTTIDAEMEHLGNPPCSFIKFDLEGHDLEGLIGAKKTLCDTPMRLVEFERWDTVELRPFQDFFDSLGWEIFVLDAEGRPTFAEEVIASSVNLFARPRHLKMDEQLESPVR